MKNLELKIWNEENVILFKIIKWRKTKDFLATNHWGICATEGSSEIIEYNKILYLNKTDTQLECVSVYSENRAKEVIAEIQEAVDQYNRKIAGPLLTEKEKSYLNNFLEPFKEDVSAIIKYREGLKEFISIEVPYYNRTIDLPPFKRHEKYKRMRENTAYTLKDLGLSNE